MALTFFFTIIWDVEVGIAVSLIISLLLVVHRSSKTRMTILVRFSFSPHLPLPRLSCAAPLQGRIPGTDRWKPIGEGSEAAEDVPGVLIIRIRENLDFGACPALAPLLDPCSPAPTSSEYRAAERCVARAGVRRCAVADAITCRAAAPAGVVRR